jgi:hypothetical protein
LKRRPPIFVLAFCVLLYLFGLLLSSCATPVPASPDSPKVACIAKSPFAAAQGKPGPNGGRLLPEVVRVIGVTSMEDGERWKVVRGTYIAAKCRGELVNDFSSCEWVPFDRDQIQFVGCGKEADSIRQIALAEEATH